MDEQITYHGFWPAPMRFLADVSAWMEWMQPFLYCLLAIAVVSLVIVLLDLAMLLWQEFHPAEAQETIKVRTTAAPVSEAKDVPSAARKLLSHL